MIHSSYKSKKVNPNYYGRVKIISQRWSLTYENGELIGICHVVISTSLPNLVVKPVTKLEAFLAALSVDFDNTIFWL